MPAECLLIQVDLLKITCLSCARQVEKDQVIRFLSNSDFLKLPWVLTISRCWEDFKYFQYDFCRNTIWDVRLKVLLIWLEENKEEKGSLINQCILTDCVCHYLVPAAEWHSTSQAYSKELCNRPTAVRHSKQIFWTIQALIIWQELTKARLIAGSQASSSLWAATHGYSCAQSCFLRSKPAF